MNIKAIEEKSGSREVVVWGIGEFEKSFFNNLINRDRLNVSFYVSKDAQRIPTYRGKPVKLFEESGLSPDKHYVIIAALAQFSEIREHLKSAGYISLPPDDYFDLDNATSYAYGEVFTKNIPCNICGNKEFSAYNSNKPRYCIICSSVERARTAYSLLAEFSGIAGMKILHISPDVSEKRVFKLLEAESVVTVDVRPKVKADMIADICNMPEVETASFDMVFCSCVLNHVYDDNAALAEIKRVLKPGGLLLVLVTGNGGAVTTVCADPTGWYGKEEMEASRVGVYRHYGDDFMQQLQQFFPVVTQHSIYDEPSGITCLWHVCER